MSATEPAYSFVLPVHDEEETLGELHRRLGAVADELDGRAELVYVDDGSTDGSAAILAELRARDPRVRVVSLSRNFGHQVAISAGLDHARGDAVVILDSDLQDPPEVVPELIARWREGYEVVHAVRRERAGETAFKRLTARVFYRLVRRYGAVETQIDTGDFRLVDRRAADALRAMPERSRYLRGMVSWVGFRQTTVPYDRDPRYAGRTKYTLPRMLSFAADALLSFSNAPLRFVLGLGFAASGVAFLIGVAAILSKVLDAYTVPGWASVIVAVAFLSGLQLIVLGVMGQYVARVYEEVKRRPLYVLREDPDRDAGRQPQPAADELRLEPHRQGERAVQGRGAEL